MAKNVNEYTMQISITGEIDKSLDRAVKNANNSLKKLNIADQFKAMDKVYGKGFDMYWSGTIKAIKGAAVATAAVTSALTLVGKKVVDVGREYESAFAGVKKTVEATEEQFAILDKTVRNMSLNIPSSAVEIAGVMEVAGQLGIATEDLASFTETMIRLGVSTNMGAEDAATALAKFANITSMDPSNYEKLGSVIVDLGNNYATTEQDIVNMATNMASTGDLLGLTAPQIMAVATAMSSVGIEAEKGGSTMSKLLKKMQLAVETDPGQLEKFAKVAGMSSEEFTNAFNEDAVYAMSAFIEGIDDVGRNGKSAVAILADMGLNEIRLSNTILALAGGEDLLSSAIAMANEAWEDNTALTEESEKRFETTDSKIDILKNSLTNLGIEGFYSIEGYIKDALEWATQLIQDFTEYATGPNGLSKWIEWLKTNIPKVISNVKKFGKTVLDFLNPVFKIGKWMWDNPEFLAKAFVSLGIALSTYKLVSSCVKIAGAIGTIVSNPVMIGITALVGAVGVLAYNALDAQENFQRLVDLKIDEIFGNVALSLSDIEDVTNYLLDNGKFDELAEAIKQIENVNEIKDAIGQAVSDLNRMNWKVGIGLKLTEDEIGTYKSDIDQFISNCQDYVIQQQYALKISIDVINDAETWNSSNIQNKLGYVYMRMTNDMASLGKQLSDVVNEAFANGILDADEINKIADIQGKMAEIQSKIAQSEYEAEMYALGREFDATSLTPESYQNLQSAVGDKLLNAQESYKQTRQAAISSAYLLYDSGMIGESELNQLISEAWNSSLDQMANLEVTASNFLLDKVMEKTSGDLIGSYTGVAKDLIDKYILSPEYASTWQNPDVTAGSSLYWMMAQDLRGAIGDDLGVMSGVASEILEGMGPLISMFDELATQYEEQGIDLPQNVKSAIENLNLFGMLATNPGEFVDNLLSSAIANDPEALAALQSFIGNIEEQAFELEENVIYNALKKAQNEAIIYANAPVAKYPVLPGHATGGIFTEPHIAAFAEAGPEAAIPINGTANARSLWLQTGKLLSLRGAFDDVEIGSGSPAINYAPSLNFYGDAPSQNDIVSALRVSKEEFAAMMDRYMRDKARVSF